MTAALSNDVATFLRNVNQGYVWHYPDLDEAWLETPGRPPRDVTHVLRWAVGLITTDDDPGSDPRRYQLTDTGRAALVGTGGRA